MVTRFRILQILAIVGLFVLVFACAWLLATGTVYEVPWYDVDPLWTP